jgi:hypothetical protein
MQETMGTRVEIPGVNIPEFAESFTSVQVLAKRVKQRSLGVHGFGAEQQEVLTMRVEQWRLDGRAKHASESY